MKRFAADFAMRGLVAAGFGPVVLAIIYGILGKAGVTDSLTTGEVCLGIISITLMAFIAGGINVIYTVERLPLISAILIHGSVLYADYLIMYMFNAWLPRNLNAVGIFTAIFISGFAVIWLIVYLINRRNADKLSRRLNDGIR